MALGDLDLAGNVLIVKDIKTGATTPGTSGQTNRNVAAGSTLTLTSAQHAGRTILLDTATGSVVTLPASTGGGDVYTFVVSTLATSNSHIVKVANASDTMQGGIVIADTDTSGAASSFFAAASSDTITLNRTTTGSVSLGEQIVLVDYALNKWLVNALLSGTGTVATPFSATV
jgi:co-chaperonin GroES (HSP10)